MGTRRKARMHYKLSLSKSCAHTQTKIVGLTSGLQGCGQWQHPFWSTSQAWNHDDNADLQWPFFACLQVTASSVQPTSGNNYRLYMDPNFFTAVNNFSQSQLAKPGNLINIEQKTGSKPGGGPGEFSVKSNNVSSANPSSDCKWAAIKGDICLLDICHSFSRDLGLKFTRIAR